MENIPEKAQFLRYEYADKLRRLDANAERKWGKMDVQQMIEHMSYAMRQASGKELYQCETPEEYLPKMQAFLASDKPFKENTPNKLLPDEPEAAKKAGKDEAIEELQEEINYFFSVFEEDRDKKIMNPFFGELDYEQWIQLLHKHAWHHLRQFGLNE